METPKFLCPAKGQAPVPQSVFFHNLVSPVLSDSRSVPHHVISQHVGLRCIVNISHNASLVGGGDMVYSCLLFNTGS